MSGQATPELGMDRIDEIVGKAIAYTEDILARSPEHIDTARGGLERMCRSLEQGAPHHPALERLRAYIEELQRRGATRRPN